MLAMFVSPMAAPIKTCRRVAFGIACCTGELGCCKRTPKKHAEIMKRPSPQASIKYSGQWLLSVSRIRSDDLEEPTSGEYREREGAAKRFRDRSVEGGTKRRWLVALLMLIIFISLGSSSSSPPVRQSHSKQA